ncbi:CDP-diacylglycerol--serine O-phosphatidyltransferase [Stigmatella aurantiaca]|uniref:CDP-diacylglycerol--serine O-phosphatidyltransferase n=1 Tax=Stigmatella aurantiaca (strain DW4/3-1) TaxID=378806 RepID=Q08RL0_STIAD|nr:CDP-diacylglycerol--serine O-phosphatidyltransferase [Stigmatella aurantiaca]ADO72965.1 CDP-diacylglycerol-serine O-phosphatidyltransferase [Stigmatella aurantiaca DW4/3-1]EAU63121.1 CDP-diacylglycerol--serine O-phosphatidyltransferase [Stigmatella aurantiaca DW4/3-1]
MTTESPGKQTRRHFSMIRTFVLADFVTLGNGFSGSGAILSAMQYLATGETRWLWLAFALMPMAFVLDALDGRIARWRFRSSPLGADLDSLADVISFGMAPAALAFAVGMRGALDVAVLLYFVACGISRLARFNVTAAELSDGTGKVRYFEGTPIPTSLALVAVLAVATWQGRIGPGAQMLGGVWELGPVSLHPLVLLYLLSGSAMISKTLRIPKF